MLYGVIDIGSNTIRLAVYEVNDRSIQALFSKKSTAGLASYVNKAGALSQKGINKAVCVLNEFKPILNNISLEKLFVFATASLRNITNSQQAIKEIYERTEFDIDLVSGEQEGIYDFAGVCAQTSLDTGLLVDIGGGSTELVMYCEGRVVKSVSIPIGSLNLYKKFVKEIFPSQTEIKGMIKHIMKELDTVEITQGYPLICGVGGTVRAAWQLNSQMFDLLPDCNKIYFKELNKIISLFFNDTKTMSKKMLKIAPERIHTILPGMLILNEVGKKYSSDAICISSFGVREGYLYTKLFSEGDVYEER
ncbi:MAG: phosphatase [Anaerotignum sp.]|nr:phosphatase [Anaerotignum sp.]